MTDRHPLTDADLPLAVPSPCPICGAKVYLLAVESWCPDDGTIEHAHFDCETEPDIDSNEWQRWNREHYRHPYIDWLPWEVAALIWLNATYRYQR